MSSDSHLGVLVKDSVWERVCALPAGGEIEAFGLPGCQSAFPKCHLPASHTALLLVGRAKPALEHLLDEGVVSQRPGGSWQSHFLHWAVQQTACK